MDAEDLSSSGSGWGAGGKDGVDEGYDWLKITTSIRLMCVVIYSVVCVLGVSGNGVVIWATGFRMKKSVSTVWYLNLAVPDFFVTAYLPLHVAERALGVDWPFGRFVCKLDSMLFHMNMFASVFTLTVISADRCVCVACPVWAQNQRTVRRAFWVSAGVWVLAVALSSAYFVLRDTEPYGDDKVMCVDNYLLVANYVNRTAEEKRLHKLRLGSMFVANFVVGFAVPFSIMVSCYSVIVYRLNNNKRSRTAAQSGRRSFRIMVAVVTAFFLCWLPYHVIRLMYVVHYSRFRESGALSLTLHLGIPLTHALALLNSCLNPQLYVFSQGVKDAFRTKNVLKVLEKVFAEDSASYQHNRPARHPSSNDRPEIEGNATGPPGTQDPSGDCPV